MKIILVDRLNYPFGGTQKYVFSLAQNLYSHGNKVYLYNGKKITQDINLLHHSFQSPNFSLITKIQSIYSVTTLIKSYLIFKKIKPDIIHLHNINYTITPSIIHAAKLLKIPIIAHLHDYKLVCPKANLLNNSGKFCHQCYYQNYFPVLRNKCTKHNNNNLLESIFLFIENQFHFKIINIYKDINYFISPSLYLKKTFSKMGFPYPIKVIPNFTLFQKKSLSKLSSKKNKLLYFGRLSPEKGLINLCQIIQKTNFHLTIIGNGPLFFKLKKISKNHKNIHVFHFQKSDNLIKTILKNDYTIVPSIWPENASISIIESLALGKPVIATNIGGTPEMVKNNYNGWLFSPLDFTSLNQIFNNILQINNQTYRQLSVNCLKTFTSKLSPEVHYQLIINLYKKCINNYQNKL